MPDIDKSTIDALTKLGRQTVEAHSVPKGNVPFVVIPSDSKVVNLGEYIHNEHAPAPERVKAAVEVFDSESFVEYYTLFNDDNSRVFASEPDISVTGVIDYHAAAGNSPRWCQHKLLLRLRPSEEWNIWTGSDGSHFSQMDFAEFLEQNATDIVTPAPATIMEVARDLEATTEVEFGAGSRTQDGQVKFKYSEQIKATVGGGTLAVPERFTVQLPVFIGGAVVQMSALLRFRVKDGKLVLWYTLLRPDAVKRQAFLMARESISLGLKISIINGKPW